MLSASIVTGVVHVLGGFLQAPHNAASADDKAQTISP
jgi:hypothetical protein